MNASLSYEARDALFQYVPMYMVSPASINERARSKPKEEEVDFPEKVLASINERFGLVLKEVFEIPSNEAKSLIKTLALLQPHIDRIRMDTIAFERSEEMRLDPLAAQYRKLAFNIIDFWDYLHAAADTEPVDEDSPEFHEFLNDWANSAIPVKNPSWAELQAALLAD